MSDFGNKLQQYAEGSDKCEHPINKLEAMPNGDEVCTLCEKIFLANPIKEIRDQGAELAAKDTRIEKLGSALSHAIVIIEAAYRYAHIVGGANKEDAMRIAEQDTEHFRALLKAKQP